MTATLKFISVTALTILAISFTVSAQKVANYAIGKLGTPNYQEYSFWVRDGKPAEITFAYGKDGKETKAVFAGKASYNGKPCFKIMFPDNKLFYVIPTGIDLQIVNAALHKTILLKWEYEGPVNGMGTYCEVCTQDEKEAMALVKKYFLRYGSRLLGWAEF